MSITYQITGMHCGACVAKVTRALQPLANAVEVNLSAQQVVLEGVSASVDDLQAALNAVGKYQIATLPKRTGQAPEVQIKLNQSVASQGLPTWLETYYPLLLIVAFILGASFLVQLGLHAGHDKGLSAFSFAETMRYFMAGFFLVFSFFKLLDLKAFANAYQSYDLLAANWPGWGLIYPFVELALGVAYLANWMPMFISGLTFVVMGFSAIGVVRAVLGKSQIQCACLGTVFKLPMSTVTIVEDLGMAMMAAVMMAMAV